MAIKKSAEDQERERLNAERATVEEELNHLREQMQAEVDVEPDEGDAEISEREKNATLIAVLERKVLDIDTAIKAMSPGINDPMTAVTCISYLRSVFVRLAERADHLCRTELLVFQHAIPQRVTNVSDRIACFAAKSFRSPKPEGKGARNRD